MVPKIYIAGPEVFLRDADAIGATKKQLCADHGFEGLFPLDAPVGPDASPGVAADRLIYRQNLALIRLADIGIFNLTPFRGIGADPGTVFELGVFVGLGKPVFGYTNDTRDMVTRVIEAQPCTREGADLRDAAGMLVEDFGGADNLMITCSLLEQNAPLIRFGVEEGRLFHDLSGFTSCLEAASASLRKHDV